MEENTAKNNENLKPEQIPAEGTETNGQEAAPAAPKLEELHAQLKDKEAKYLYLYAEFENFKKRSIKERSDLLKFGWENTARDLLQVVDNLERALAHVPPATDKALMEGLQMVLNQFRDTLRKQGVQVIESVGKPFDPNLHEALAQAPSDQPEGTVSQEHSKGYTLHGRLLRPARVVVSSGDAKKNNDSG